MYSDVKYNLEKKITQDKTKWKKIETDYYDSTRSEVNLGREYIAHVFLFILII